MSRSTIGATPVALSGSSIDFLVADDDDSQVFEIDVLLRDSHDIACGDRRDRFGILLIVVSGSPSTHSPVIAPLMAPTDANVPGRPLDKRFLCRSQLLFGDRTRAENAAQLLHEFDERGIGLVSDDVTACTEGTRSFAEAEPDPTP